MSRFIAAFVIGAGLCAAQSDTSDSNTQQRIEQFRLTQLQQNPNDISLLLKLGAMKQEDRAFDEAQSYYQRVLAIDANNVTAIHNLGVIAWTPVFAALRTARKQLSMEPETPGPLRDRATRAVLNANYAHSLGDAVAYFERALAIDPQDNEAMGYLNVVYRSKADLEDTPLQYREDIATADGWVRKALETAKAKHVQVQEPEPLARTRPPAPLDSPNSPARIRVGGNVQAANLIQKVDPVYPQTAQLARIQGLVRFDAIIAKDGTIANLTVVSGHPMLVQAALEAVKRWVYKPTVLNGAPVEVITTIEVPFTLP